MATKNVSTTAAAQDVKQLLGILEEFSPGDVVRAISIMGLACASTVLEAVGTKIYRWEAVNSWFFTGDGTYTGEEKGDNWTFTAKEDGKLKVTYTNGATQEVNLNKDGKIIKDGPTVVASGVSE